MSVTNKNTKSPIKITVLVLGGLLIAAGITPYINSYLLSQDETKTTQENSGSQTSETPQNIVRQESEQTKIFAENKQTETTTLQESDQQTTNSKKDKVQLPELLESDDFFLNNINLTSTQSLFVPLDIIRNMVVFIDNFSRGELVSNFSPLERPDGEFFVSEQDGIYLINIDSYLRYDKYARAISELNTENFIRLYSLLTPLIDEAYQEIGYPSGNFNNTFLQAIDHVLETPIIFYQLELTLPSVMYQYADEHLESLPDTQKLLLRMGPDNLQMIKFKLRQIQNELQRL
jgi:hypothetical protein